MYKPHFFGQILGLELGVWLIYKKLYFGGLLMHGLGWRMQRFSSSFKRLVFGLLEQLNSSWHGGFVPMQSCLQMQQRLPSPHVNLRGKCIMVLLYFNTHMANFCMELSNPQLSNNFSPVATIS